MSLTNSIKELNGSLKAKLRTQNIRTVLTAAYSSNTYFGAYTFPNKYTNAPAVTINQASIDGYSRVVSRSIQHLTTDYVSFLVNVENVTLPTSIVAVQITITNND